MRTAALLLVAVTALGAPSVAQAGWDPAQATSHRLRPLAAAASGGVFSIWGPAGSAARRLTLPTDAISRLPFPSDILSGPWLANRRGDVLLIDHVGSDGALLVEAGGAQARMNMEIPREENRVVAAALGEDGAAVVAWVAERPAGTVRMRVRPPGGEFGPEVVLPNRGPVFELDADIGPDGRAELVYAVGTGTTPTRSSTRSTGRRPWRRCPSRCSASRWWPAESSTPPAGTRPRPYSPARQPDGRRSGLKPTAESASLHIGSPTAASCWPTPRAATCAFDAPLPAASSDRRSACPRVPRGSVPNDVTVASTPTGALLLAWREIVIDDCVRDWCFDRVLAAAADPGRPLGPARLVSPLGLRTDEVVAALADDGRRLVAWHAESASATAPNALWTASGDATPDAPVRTDRTPPRVRVLSRRRGKQLRLRLRSNEPVAVRAFVGDTSRGRAVVIGANRATTAVWSLSRYQRAQRTVVIVAADAAGNLTRL